MIDPSQKRLGIVIPYRDREQHLSKLLPHLAVYFARDKIDRHIPARVIVVEQAPGLPFNRGLIKNIGFMLIAADIDYVCFHDVDYLPIWADYSYPERPSMIVWYGMERRPINPEIPNTGFIVNDLERCFSAVVLIRNEHFIAANGYANDYWGWGAEDGDLERRLMAALNVGTVHRKGTFQALDHSHAGFGALGAHSAENVRNTALFKSRWDQPNEEWRQHGLSTVKFQLESRRPVAFDAKMEREILFEHVRVAFPPAQ